MGLVYVYIRMRNDCHVIFFIIQEINITVVHYTYDSYSLFFYVYNTNLDDCDVIIVTLSRCIGGVEFTSIPFYTRG